MIVAEKPGTPAKNKNPEAMSPDRTAVNISKYLEQNPLHGRWFHDPQAFQLLITESQIFRRKESKRCVIAHF
ncbi:hypothetical protein NYE76_03615 [Paenibacillus sp. FSL M7-0831]|uniref:hypothetical protein n=1 Tax=Paenibacillus macerans TaxID=44252 RepID=UPI001D132694|nr:hypothetical protein [Paenibacillus macerans]MBS5909951.1 hypothetical protein [Paenibacillus macerans]MEC0331337.1 hypothetical protein [Paenibacillus macerans]